MNGTKLMMEGARSYSSFSPAGRSAERSEAMRGPLALRLTPSSGATRHLLPAGEKGSRERSASPNIHLLPAVQEAYHAPRS